MPDYPVYCANRSNNILIGTMCGKQMSLLHVQQEQEKEYFKLL